MVDMHIHTNNSDGQYSTKEIVEKIKELDIELFSITDHDNINSCNEMEKIILPSNIEYIPGVEFSSINGIYNCHILGYNIDYKNTNLIRKCEIINEKRQNKIRTIINHLEQNRNIHFEEDELNNLFNKQTVSRYDICKILLKKGYGDKTEIYEKYLTNVKGVRTHRLEIEDITKTIKDSNGIAVLAHPKKIEQAYEIDIEEVIEDFIEKGIEGLEVYNTVHTLKEIRKYLSLAQKYNLLITGGSDFHGESHPERKLGRTTLHKVKLNSSNIKLY